MVMVISACPLKAVVRNKWENGCEGVLCKCVWLFQAHPQHELYRQESLPVLLTLAFLVKGLRISVSICTFYLRSKGISNSQRLRTADRTFSLFYGECRKQGNRGPELQPRAPDSWVSTLSVKAVPLLLMSKNPESEEGISDESI